MKRTSTSSAEQSGSSSLRSDRVIQQLDSIVGRAVEEPVKRAVKEALREEREREADAAEVRTPRSRQPDAEVFRKAQAEEEGGGSWVRRLLAFVGLVAVAGFIAQRRREGGSDVFSESDDRSAAGSDESRPESGSHGTATGVGAAGADEEDLETTTNIVGEDDDGSSGHDDEE